MGQGAARAHTPTRSNLGGSSMLGGTGGVGLPPLAGGAGGAQQPVKPNPATVTELFKRLDKIRNT